MVTPTELPFRSIGREAAIAMAETKWWEGKPYHEIAMTGFFIRELCLPFDVFHEAVEKTLGRPVWTHEFATPGRIGRELLGQREPPTLEEIMNLIPAEKRILVVKDAK